MCHIDIPNIFVLYPPGTWHKDYLCALKHQESCHLREARVIADHDAYLAVLRVEHRDVVAHAEVEALQAVQMVLIVAAGHMAFIVNEDRRVEIHALDLSFCGHRGNDIAAILLGSLTKLSDTGTIQALGGLRKPRSHNIQVVTGAEKLREANDLSSLACRLGNHAAGFFHIFIRAVQLALELHQRDFYIVVHFYPPCYARCTQNKSCPLLEDFISVKK